MLRIRSCAVQCPENSKRNLAGFIDIYVPFFLTAKAVCITLCIIKDMWLWTLESSSQYDFCTLPHNPYPTPPPPGPQPPPLEKVCQTAYIWIASVWNSTTMKLNLITLCSFIAAPQVYKFSPNLVLVRVKFTLNVCFKSDFFKFLCTFKNSCVWSVHIKHTNSLWCTQLSIKTTTYF